MNKVQTTVSEYNQTKTMTSPNRKSIRAGVVEKLDDFDKNGIRRKRHLFWQNRELPTIAKVLTAINEDGTWPSLKKISLKKVLKSLHFKFTKLQRNIIYKQRREIYLAGEENI